MLWLLYPVIVILGPDGLEFWSATFATACITLLDLTAKVIYGFISMGGSKTITSSDVSRGEVSAAEISTHSVPSEAPVPGAAMPGDARQPARVV